MKISTNIDQNIKTFQEQLHCDKNFDIVYRTIKIMDKTACFFFVDGFAKDEIMTKMMDAFFKIQDQKLLTDAYTFSKSCISYGEIGLEDDLDKLFVALLSGQIVMMLDGFDRAVLIDARTYPQRTTSEPEKDKVFRGSHDGFVETLVLNSALIRRRIRSPELCMQHLSIGTISHTDVSICYMNNKVSQTLLNQIVQKLKSADVESLTMNQESLVEVLLKRKWYNPFPKVKFTERPDTTAAQILEGDIAILVDNSPSAIILPSTIFHLMEEANDYYFPPLTGAYLRLSRFAVLFVAIFLTPVWILLTQYPDIVPEWLKFILITEDISVPLLLQLLMLEVAIDGLQLASLNTPNMLATPLSIIAAIIVGDYAVQSGWFSPQALLYQAFVTLANFSQPGFELGYALKFFRILLLIVTGAFGIWGFVSGVLFLLIVLVCNKTVTGKCYLYPLVPFNWQILKRHLFRMNIKNHPNKKRR